MRNGINGLSEFLGALAKSLNERDLIEIREVLVDVLRVYQREYASRRVKPSCAVLKLLDRDEREDE